jgi:calnexin
MDDGYFFDNVVVSNSEAEAALVREDKWAPKRVVEDAQEEEEAKKAAEAAAKAAAEGKAEEGGDEPDDDDDTDVDVRAAGDLA